MVDPVLDLGSNAFLVIWLSGVSEVDDKHRITSF